MYFGKGKLNEIVQFLDAKWPTPRTCAVCHENPDHWRISETPILLPLLTGRANISMQNFARAAESLAVAPAVALTCSNCGHIMLFSAAQLGLTPVELDTETRSSIPSE